MSHPLEQRLRQVRRRVRGLLAVYGVARVAAIVLGAVMLFGFVDYLLQFRDPGLRLFCTLAVVGLFCWTVQRHLWRSISIPWHDTDLARRLGRHFPGLGDALPSAVEFLHQREDDPTAGSLALRRAVVVQATSDMENVNLSDAIRVGPVGKALATATAILCLALGIILVAPASASVALSRLANPFGRTIWPQTTHLAILQTGPSPPLKIDSGEVFSPVIRSLSGDRLPDDLCIQYHFDPASGSDFDETRVTLGASVGRVTRRANVQVPFGFRLLVDGQPWSQWANVRVGRRPAANQTETGTLPSEPVLVARLLPEPEKQSEDELQLDRRLAVLLEQHRVERVARGDVFEVEFIDARGARLPSTARVFFRWRNEDGRWQEEEGTVQHLGEKLRVRRENVTRTFSYRIEAGDDRQMPWIPVEVVPAPRIDDHETLVTPPAYTNLPAGETDTMIRTLKGSRVRITATANRELSSAAFCSEEGDRIDCPVTGPGRRTVSVEFPVENSAAYWFELTDTEELAGGRTVQWDVRALSDLAPTVTVEEPSGNIYVTPRANVPLRVSAKDDLSVRDMTLKFARDDAEVPQQVPLYRRPQNAPVAEEAVSGDLQTVEHIWALGKLSLQPGIQISFHVEASDDLPQVGLSEIRRVTIITPEELAERIANRQSLILSELSRVLEMQRDCRRQTTQSEIRLRETATLLQTDVDQLRGAELNQRQVNRALTAEGEGVPMHVRGLLAELDNNGIDSPDIRRRMEGILARLDRLQDEHLPQITLNLTTAIKGAQIQLERDSADAAIAEITTPLGNAGGHQDSVIAALEEMLGQLSQWENFRQFHRRVAQLLREQKELASQTTSLAQKTLGRDYRDLTPQEIADLKVQSRRQFELSRDLDRIEDEMRSTIGQIEASDPLAAETVADALAESRRQSISTAMRDAGQAVDENRMGRAVERQQATIDALQTVLDILGNRREYELARLIRRLEQAEQQLDELAQREAALQEEIEKAAENQDETERQRQLERLRTAQDEIEQETQRATRQLERLSANDAAENTEAAGKNMQQSSEAASSGDAKKAASDAKQAQEKLEQARQQVADRKRQAEAELAFEQLARLEDSLKALRQRQQAALQGTRRLDRLRSQQGELSEAQQATLVGLAREQALLEDETGRTGKGLSAAAVFSLVLDQAAADMGAAHARLVERETGLAAQQAQTSAIARLDRLVEALQPVEPKEDEANDDGGGDGQGQGGDSPPQAPGDALKAMAELKLLKLMQVGINERTRTLEARYGTSDQLPEEAVREYARLSREQGQLADLLIGLMQESQAPEDTPERLPTLDPDDPSLDLDEVR